MNNKTREYMFLYNMMIRAIKDMENMQAWATGMCDSAKQTYQKGDVDIAVETMYEPFWHLETRIQQIQRMLIRAQVTAEKLHLYGEY